MIAAEVESLSSKIKERNQEKEKEDEKKKKKEEEEEEKEEEEEEKKKEEEEKEFWKLNKKSTPESGMKVKIWWKAEKCWFEGIIVRQSESDPRKWWVKYNDR
ncbi:MAG: hypothetical protein ACXV2C_03540 [Candidatus Bathyarchaeia archaeon]